MEEEEEKARPERWSNRSRGPSPRLLCWTFTWLWREDVAGESSLPAATEAAVVDTLEISKPASPSDRAMRAIKSVTPEGAYVCCTVTTDVTILGDTQRISAPQALRTASLMAETHDGQCRLAMRKEVVMTRESEDGSRRLDDLTPVRPASLAIGARRVFGVEERCELIKRCRLVGSTRRRECV